MSRSPDAPTARLSLRRERRIGPWLWSTEQPILVCVCALARAAIHGENIRRLIRGPTITPSPVIRCGCGFPVPPWRRLGRRWSRINRCGWLIVGPSFVLIGRLIDPRLSLGKLACETRVWWRFGLITAAVGAMTTGEFRLHLRSACQIFVTLESMAAAWARMNPTAHWSATVQP